MCCPGLPNLHLLPTVCGFFEGERIIGGEKTDIGEYPWLALLEYERCIDTFSQVSFNT